MTLPHPPAPSTPHPSGAVDAGDPATDSRAFRRCLGQFATGVAVVTARHGEHTVGMTINSFAALSLDPPLVLWSIRQESKALAVLEQAGHFAINILSSEQLAVSQLFSTSDADRFSRVEWVEGQRGAPLLNGVMATLECRLDNRLEGGDHIILVGHVERYARFAGEPLLFSQGRYGVAQDHPDMAPAAPSSGSPADVRTQALAGTFLRLLFRTSHYAGAGFEAQCEAEGLSVVQARVLSRLYEQPLAAARLQQMLLLQPGVADDVAADLRERGYVSMDNEQRYELTAIGRARRQSMDAQMTRFESELFTGIAPGDIETTRRVLSLLSRRLNPAS